MTVICILFSGQSAHHYVISHNFCVSSTHSLFILHCTQLTHFCVLSCLFLLLFIILTYLCEIGTNGCCIHISLCWIHTLLYAISVCHKHISLCHECIFVSHSQFSWCDLHKFFFHSHFLPLSLPHRCVSSTHIYVSSQLCCMQSMHFLCIWWQLLCV